jgi:hypothetical protein
MKFIIIAALFICGCTENKANKLRIEPTMENCKVRLEELNRLFNEGRDMTLECMGKPPRKPIVMNPGPTIQRCEASVLFVEESVREVNRIYIEACGEVK